VFVPTVIYGCEIWVYNKERDKTGSMEEEDSKENISGTKTEDGR
jgi:hypothetical protein